MRGSRIRPVELIAHVLRLFGPFGSLIKYLYLTHSRISMQMQIYVYNTFPFRRYTCCHSSCLNEAQLYKTSCLDGYIIRTRPIAIGIDAVPTCKLVMKFVTSAEKYPMLTPITIAKKIQSVKNLSNRDNFFTSDLGTQHYLTIRLFICLENK